MKARLVLMLLAGMTTTGEGGAGAQPIRFDAPRSFATCDAPSQVLPMDLDGDGDTDAVVACVGTTSAGQLRLLRNPGDGTLVAQTTLARLGTGVLVPADLDGDGLTDLVQATMTGTGAGQIGVYARSGAFAFTTRTQALPFDPGGLAVGNLDGTGRPDLVMPDDLAGPAVRVYLSDGAGGYTEAGRFDTEDLTRDVSGDGLSDAQCSFTPVDVVAGDVDGDGDDDVIVAQTMTRYLRTPGMSVMDAADLCNMYSPGKATYDPKRRSGSVALLVNLGGGGFAAYRLVVDNDDGQLALGDLDGDGDLDLVLLGLGKAGADVHAVEVLLNDGAGGFAAPVAFASGGGLDSAGDPELVDTDGDGDLDVALLLHGPPSGNTNDPLTDRWALLRNGGGGNLGPPEIHPTGAEALDLAFAQMDGAAGPDALTAAADDGHVSVHYAQAGIYPAPALVSTDDPATPTFGAEPVDIGSGDVDGDGLVDVLVATDASRLLDDGPDALVLLRGVAGGLSGTPVFFGVAEGPVRLLVEPFAGGPEADVAILSMGDDVFGDAPGVGVALGGAAGPGAMRFAALGGMPQGVGALDLDDDGTEELAVLRIRDEGVTAGITLLDVANDGALTPLQTLVLGSDDVLAGDTRLPNALATADMDGDGRKDLIAATWNALGTANAIVTVLISNGDRTFRLGGEVLSAPRQVTSIAAADVTRDGLRDVVVTTVASLTDGDPSGSVEVLINQGGGRLLQGPSYDAGQGPTRVVAVDMDGVNGPDLVVSADGGNVLTILLNDGSGAFPVQERYLTGGGTDALTVADLDADGDLDVAVSNHQELSGVKDDHRGTVSVLLGRAVANPLNPPPVGPAGPPGGAQPAPGGGGGCATVPAGSGALFALLLALWAVRRAKLAGS